MPKAPAAPGDLAKPGRALWREIMATYEVDVHEMPLLHEAARLADRAAELEELIAADGLTVTGSMKQPRLHPAIAEARQTRLALARILGAIAFPDEQGRPLTARGRHAQLAVVARWREVPPRGA